MNLRYISKSEKETSKIAARLAKQLKGGEIVALEGELGAGKTIFVKALARALGIKHPVLSPTFVLMKVYECRLPEAEIRRSAPKIWNLVHVDCYRLDDPQELFYLGLEEYLNKKNTVVIIEWADKIRKYLKKFKKIIWIKILINKSKRIFIISKL